MSNPRENVFNAICEERSYQDRKWGTTKDRPHTVAEWILIAEAELEEAKKAWTKECSDQRTLEELLQTAAVLVAALEQYSVVATKFPPGQNPQNLTPQVYGLRQYNLHYAKD